MGLQGAEQHLEKWILCDMDKSLNLSGPQFHDAQNEEIGPDPPGPKSSYNLVLLFCPSFMWQHYSVRMDHFGSVRENLSGKCGSIR